MTCCVLESIMPSRPAPVPVLSGARARHGMEATLASCKPRWRRASVVSSRMKEVPSRRRAIPPVSMYSDIVASIMRTIPVWSRISRVHRYRWASWKEARHTLRREGMISCVFESLSMVCATSWSIRLAKPASWPVGRQIVWRIWRVWLTCTSIRGQHWLLQRACVRPLSWRSPVHAGIWAG